MIIRKALALGFCLVVALRLRTRGDLLSCSTLFKATILCEKENSLSAPVQKATSPDQEIQPLLIPPEGLNPSRGLCYTSITPIRFYQNQVTLEDPEKKTLDKLCECLRENLSVNLILRGSSGPQESPPKELTARRVRAVKKYLIEGHCGLNAERLSDQGSTTVGPAVGGRVEFKVRK